MYGRQDMAGQGEGGGYRRAWRGVIVEDWKLF